MATLCVSCAALPVKKRGAATRVQRCAQCQADIGVTSYGSAFRVLPGKSFLTAKFVQNIVIGSGLVALAFAGVGVHLAMRDAAMPNQGKQVEAAPVVQVNNANLLAENGALKHPYVIERNVPTELRGIPEVALFDFPQGLTPQQANADLRGLWQQIKQENAQKRDGFLLAHMHRREEIRGLPFIMGDACRMDQGKGQQLQASVTSVRANVDAYTGSPKDFFRCFGDVQSDSAIAALTQILGPETPDMRKEMAQQLSRSLNPAASKTLAKAAIFDTDPEVRYAAIKALKGRPGNEYADVLLHGMRYPMPVVAGRAAQAIIELKRTELLPQLAALLDEKAPGDPVEAQVDGATVHVVREVVRVNHHRNCFMCHAPAETGSAAEVPGLAPSPGTPFPRLSQEYYGENQVTGGPAVRADTTYLRQDFSAMMPVGNHGAWPEKQRFDFLVRTRVVGGEDLANLQADIAARPANFLSANHKAALIVLRDLTGQDAEPNTAAWMTVLAKN